MGWRRFAAFARGWRRFALFAVGALLSAACGILPLGSAPQPTVNPTVEPSPTSIAPTATTAPLPTATAAPKPTDTPVPTQSDTVWVGNTDGQGVYVRNTPAMADRARAYADGTPLTIIGDDVDGDGQHWKHVRTPDGLEGYVPSTYTTDAPP